MGTFKIGDTVLVPEPNDTDIHEHSFTGNVIAFRSDLVQVEDSEGDVFEIETERLILEK